jgi:DNA-binding LytR/AlgR family response regulator
VGAVTLSALHVSLFVILRKLVFGVLGRSYEFGSLANFPYEFRKDLVGYAVGVATFWALTRLAERNDTARAPAEATQEPPRFDIRDGAKLIRTPVSEILAATSAGNYVEFHLADGRRPMMRISLSALEAELGPHGFVRTHRSWLVNAGQVRELRPESSGDYRVVLGPVEAPISRRFPEALSRLRAGL